MNEDSKYTVVKFLLVLVITVSLTMIMIGCTTTGRVTEYDVDCDSCKFKMTHDIDSNEFEKGF